MVELKKLMDQIYDLKHQIRLENLTRVKGMLAELALTLQIAIWKENPRPVKREQFKEESEM